MSKTIPIRMWLPLSGCIYRACQTTRLNHLGTHHGATMFLIVLEFRNFEKFWFNCELEIRLFLNSSVSFVFLKCDKLVTFIKVSILNDHVSLILSCFTIKYFQVSVGFYQTWSVYAYVGSRFTSNLNLLICLI